MNSYKKFSIYILLYIVFIYLLSAFLHFTHHPYTNNELTLDYQLKKIKKIKNKKIKTLIIGDSSAGNSVDAKYLQTLSKQSTVNLALTGSFGINGSLNMLKRISKEHQELKNIIIIQTLDIWKRPFSKTAFFQTNNETLSNNKHLIKNIFFENLKYIFNLKEIRWFIKNQKHKLKTTIDLNYDYMKQEDKKFSNHKKTLKDKTLDSLIHKDKINALRELDDFCYQKNLNCIYLHGPLHETIVQNSKKIIKKINMTISSNIQHIHFIPSSFSVKERYLGDSNDHIDIKYKKESTKIIYSKIQKFIK